MFRSFEEKYWKEKAERLEAELDKLGNKNVALEKELNCLKEAKSFFGVKSAFINWTIDDLAAGGKFLVPGYSCFRQFVELPTGFAFLILHGDHARTTDMGVVKTKQEAHDYAKEHNYLKITE